MMKLSQLRNFLAVAEQARVRGGAPPRSRLARSLAQLENSSATRSPSAAQYFRDMVPRAGLHLEQQHDAP